MIPTRRCVRRCFRLAVVAVVLPGAVLALALRLTPLPDWWTAGAQPGPGTLVRVLDRDGNELSRVRRPGPACRPVTREMVDPLLVRATLAAEDRRFHLHGGVDPFAVLRAAAQNLQARRRVSGGSTLTQQLVKLLRTPAVSPPPRRTLSTKLVEAYWAGVVEAHLPKREILLRYLNEASYGCDVQGVGAAAEIYFGHDVSRLTHEEAALLAALPRSPVRTDPRRDPEAARLARDRVLAALDLTADELVAARARPVVLASASGLSLATRAPHWIVRALATHPTAVELCLPIDPALQACAQEALRRTMRDLAARGADAGGIVVLDNANGEVRAWVGSAEWSDPSHGQFDATAALRQPGSTLKPFTYALAFEAGLRPATVVPDLPAEYGGAEGAFRPRNYSGFYHGPVRARLALANSWNAPAVALLARLGPASLLDRLRAAGITSLDRTAEEYGLGLTLGDGEVSLMELTTAYACLARGGVACSRVEILAATEAGGTPLALREPEQGAGAVRIFDPVAVALVQSILADPDARARAFGEGGAFAFPFPLAIKTGTSSDWRDNWAFGFTPQWTLGVWVGRAEGTPMDRVSGAQGAMRALREVALFLHDRNSPASDEDCAPGTPLESRSICALSGEAPTEACPEIVSEWFAPGDPPLVRCRWHRRLPIDLATGLIADSDVPAGRVRSALFIVPPDGGASEFTWPAAPYVAWGREHGWPDPPLGDLAAAAEGDSEQPLVPDPARSSAAPPPAPAAQPVRLRILRPVDGTIYALDPSLPTAQQEIALVASGPDGEIRWTVDGRETGRSRPGETLTWRLREGRHSIRAEPAEGRGFPNRREGREAPPAHEIVIVVEPAS